MKSIKNLYKIGHGPSSSHAMAPARAAEMFRKKMVSANSSVQVELLGSLAKTGRGHLTDKAILRSFDTIQTEIVFNDASDDLKHPNTMIFRELSNDSTLLQEWEVYSVGGGELSENPDSGSCGTNDDTVYSFKNFSELKNHCKTHGVTISDFVESQDGRELRPVLSEVWDAMKASIQRGLDSPKDVLPGPLKLRRKAGNIFAYANKAVGIQRNLALIHSYALAAAEENADGGIVVAAPTCGSCGVLPSILFYFHQNLNYDENEIFRALMVAGVIGLFIQRNASISGARVGCQGEIGSACAMAAAAAAYLQKGSLEQIEYAAEMGIEHFLGLTCDPILGLVQIPCIERNALASLRALECSIYVLSTQLGNKISFDEVVGVMYKTGIDMQSTYKETALGGLAMLYQNYME